MLRKDKEIQQKEILEQVISKAQVLRLGMCKDNQPYVVPVSFGYNGSCFYFHSAREGMKIDYFTANNRVCFELDHEVNVLPSDKAACNWSVSFQSIIGWGRVEEVTDQEKKLFALNCIMNHYSPGARQWEYNIHMLEKTRLWQITIETMTGKKSKD